MNQISIFRGRKKTRMNVSYARCGFFFFFLRSFPFSFIFHLQQLVVAFMQTQGRPSLKTGLEMSDATRYHHFMRSPGPHLQYPRSGASYLYCMLTPGLRCVHYSHSRALDALSPYFGASAASYP